MLYCSKQEMALAVIMQIKEKGAQTFQQLTTILGDHWSVLGLLERYDLVVARNTPDFAPYGREYCLTSQGAQVALNPDWLPQLVDPEEENRWLSLTLLLIGAGYILLFGYLTTMTKEHRSSLWLLFRMHLYEVIANAPVVL